MHRTVTAVALAALIVAADCVAQAQTSAAPTPPDPASAKSDAVAAGGDPGIRCTNVTGVTHVIDIPWGTQQRAYTVKTGGFGPDDALVVRFTTGTIATSSGKGFINAGEHTDAPAQRAGSLSATPCDFTGGLPAVGGGVTAFANETSPGCSFSVVIPKTGAATLRTGTTYYFNIRNASCPAGSCNMQITLNKPTFS